jgi:TRAP-type C4-dicarboxylate transport system substrate-binding protein
LLCATVARAEPVKLRMASIVPDGSAWAREIKAFAREVEARTAGRVVVKWYLGAIAGDELEVLERIKRDQLDGQGGAQMCDRLAPSLQVMRLMGLFQTRAETLYVLGRLRPIVESEFKAHGFQGWFSGLGYDMLFTRTPVRSLADLRHVHPWLWDLDELMRAQLKAIDVTTVPVPINLASKAFDDGRLDSFVALPMGALAFQWSARTRYFTDLHIGFMPACMVITNKALDALPLGDQEIVRESAAKLQARLDDLGQEQDRQLLEGLFQKQGLTPTPASETFRSEFFSAAREARKAVPPQMVPPALILRAEGWLADYRAEHH